MKEKMGENSKEVDFWIYIINLLEIFIIKISTVYENNLRI
jgi:hypothetical protein